MKLLILDLDGTIRKPNNPNHKFITHPSDQKIITGAEEAIAQYSLNDWKIIGISNQGGIQSGHKTLLNTISEMQYTLHLFPAIDRIYFAPDYKGINCWRIMRNDQSLIKQHPGEFGSFHKPGPGMINLVKRYFQPSDTLYIGDRNEDLLAAAAANIRFEWAKNWRIKLN